MKLTDDTADHAAATARTRAHEDAHAQQRTAAQLAGWTDDPDGPPPRLGFTATLRHPVTVSCDWEDEVDEPDVRLRLGDLDVGLSYEGGWQVLHALLGCLVDDAYTLPVLALLERLPAPVYAGQRADPAVVRALWQAARTWEHLWPERRGGWDDRLWGVPSVPGEPVHLPLPAGMEWEAPDPRPEYAQLLLGDMPGQPPTYAERPRLPLPGACTRGLDVDALLAKLSRKRPRAGVVVDAAGRCALLRPALGTDAGRTWQVVTPTASDTAHADALPGLLGVPPYHLHDAPRTVDEIVAAVLALRGGVVCVRDLALSVDFRLRAGEWEVRPAYDGAHTGLWEPAGDVRRSVLSGEALHAEQVRAGLLRWGGTWEGVGPVLVCPLPA